MWKSSKYFSQDYCCDAITIFRQLASLSNYELHGPKISVIIHPSWSAFQTKERYSTSFECLDELRNRWILYYTGIWSSQYYFFQGNLTNWHSAFCTIEKPTIELNIEADQALGLLVQIMSIVHIIWSGALYLSLKTICVFEEQKELVQLKLPDSNSIR